MHLITKASLMVIVIVALTAIDARTISSRSRVRHLDRRDLIRSIADARSSIDAISDGDVIIVIRGGQVDISTGTNHDKDEDEVTVSDKTDDDEPSSNNYKPGKNDEQSNSKEHCEAITAPLCQNLPYNDTRLPNNLGHQTQSEAAVEMHQFSQLIKVQCSFHLRLFLCSIYVPVCTVLTDNLIPPCRSLCENARRGCDTLLNRFGFQWPENLDCSRFPVNGLCIGGTSP